ncbi:MAG: DegT/DnrJ/EryC1/StrS family aminotransferase [Candidatus Berkelbacteria bacterium]
MIKITQPIIGQEEIDAVVEVMKSGVIAQGPITAKFEEEFANFCGTKYASAMSNGTTALHAALYACGIKEGDEVITTPFTFVATANSILMQNATPVFVDIDPETYLIDPKEVVKKITSKTKAILPVDLYGQVYDVEEIGEIAKSNNLMIIEDACQAHGAEYKGKKSGTFGDAACFSLYATKNMVTGEGGMLTTDNEEINDKARMFRHHGQSEKVRYTYFDLGYNYRLTDIASAIGREQLKKLDSFTDARIRNATKLSEGLKDIPGIVIPKVKADCKHVFHQFTIRVTKDFPLTRDELSEYLTKNEIGNAIFYPKPLHTFPQFEKFGYKLGDFPIAEAVSREVLSLPVYPLVTDENIEFIIKSIKEAGK